MEYRLRVPLRRHKRKHGLPLRELRRHVRDSLCNQQQTPLQRLRCVDSSFPRLDRDPFIRRRCVQRPPRLRGR